jgi:hypothetical protein
MVVIRHSPFAIRYSPFAIRHSTFYLRSAGGGVRMLTKFRAALAEETGKDGG